MHLVVVGFDLRHWCFSSIIHLYFERAGFAAAGSSNHAEQPEYEKGHREKIHDASRRNTKVHAARSGLAGQT
jgi:hypothetical protein